MRDRVQRALRDVPALSPYRSYKCQADFEINTVFQCDNFLVAACTVAWWLESAEMARGLVGV